jgi:alkylation response protein AidB-like acyl-CoA dehydrogenase
MTQTTPQALDALSDDAFRETFSRWLAEHYPAAWRQPVLLRLDAEQERWWVRTLQAGGWRAPGLPRAAGGMGLTLARQLIYRDVLEQHRVARVFDIGLQLLAPILLQYGTPAQRAGYLPRILSGEDRWCQGYSEPGAGSDLASLRLRAERRGEHCILNGQKIWTSDAAAASHIFLLVRTSTEARKQQGITFLLTAMDTPGITVRPIANLSGEQDFCGVFFDDVPVPAAQVVGEIGQGWQVAKTMLGIERLMTGSPSLARYAFGYLLRLIDALGIWPRMQHDERLLRAAADLQGAVAVYDAVCQRAVHGALCDADYSTIKILSSEVFQQITELMLDLAAERGALQGAWDPSDPAAFDVGRLFAIARPATVYGGAGEVQRDIIARSLVGPPGRRSPA